MAELKLTTPLGQPEKPGAPPIPSEQAKPAAPPSLAEWYRGEMATLIPKFDAASKAAQESIAQRRTELAGFRQRAATAPGVPESPELPEAPPAPKITARPFLSGMPGEDPVQSLNKLMASMGLMAQMAVGIKGGYPGGALAAYTGALNGWAAGDQRRAANEWQTYLGELKQYDRDVGAIRLKYEDTIRRWGADQDKLKTELGILAAEHGLGREAIALSFQDPHRAMEQLTTTAKLLSDMQTSAANLALKNAMWLDDRSIKLADLALKTRDLERKEDQASRTQAMLDRILSGQGMPGGGGMQFQPTVSFGPSGATVGFAPQPPASGEATTMAIGAERLKTAADTISAIKSNPAKKKIVDDYLGPVAGRTVFGKRPQQLMPGGALGEVPPDVIDLDQNLASLNNYTIKLITGAQMGEREADRIRGELPDTTLPPADFWRKYDTTLKNIRNMEGTIERAQRGRLSQPWQPGGAPAAPGPALPPGAKMEGNEIVSESGKFIWRGGAWQPR